MRESDVAEIWEDALRRMRDCFDFSNEAEEHNRRSLSAPGADPGGLGSAEPGREGSGEAVQAD